ncbi:MAG: hypothetical protein V3U78_04725 [Thiotrichaceae bacterium]
MKYKPDYKCCGMELISEKPDCSDMYDFLKDDKEPDSDSVKDALQEDAELLAKHIDNLMSDASIDLPILYGDSDAEGDLNMWPKPEHPLDLYFTFDETTAVVSNRPVYRVNLAKIVKEHLTLEPEKRIRNIVSAELRKLADMLDSSIT